MAELVDKALWFPDARQARSDGLVAVGGDLSLQRMLLAYRSGLFPWSAEPVTWWSPDPRAVFDIGGLHLPRSLVKTLKRAPYRVTYDRAFGKVIRACSTVPRKESANWISPAFIESYSALAAAGHAHSVECWRGDDLVGGIYGVSIGGFFAGESMFHRADDASKIALVHLERRLAERGYRLFDTQMLTPTTLSLGAHEISRAAYLDRLGAALAVSCAFV
jgi:leucyl/phenylalanyl-tRNA--protein transferase